MADANNSSKPTVVICVGDIHGYIRKLETLWYNLEAHIDAEDFSSALVIFLGDYCDRGPDTKKVIDFLIGLPSKYPMQRHVFLSGNHDLAFAAFLRLLPKPGNGKPFEEGWKEYHLNKDREGWYEDEGYEDMYLQGRRWAGKIRDKFNASKGLEFKGSIYDAAPTFHSYGVPHGSAELMRAVPDEHKDFLRNMVWVHEEDGVNIDTEDGIKQCKLIAVHAGLEKGKNVEEQIHYLKAKDTRVPKIRQLSGRNDVWEIPSDCKPNATIIVSGHHAKLLVEGLRLVIDEGGGYPDRPIAAIVLPSKKIIRDTD